MQMDSSFKPGDVVQLNSGGPKMTVVAAQSDGTLRCTGSMRMASKTTGFLHKSRFALPKRRIEARTFSRSSVRFLAWTVERGGALGA